MNCFLDAGMDNLWAKNQDLYRYLSILLGSLEGMKILNGGSEYSGHVTIRVEREDFTTEQLA